VNILAVGEEPDVDHRPRAATERLDHASEVGEHLFEDGARPHLLERRLGRAVD
jgi:hypothetical protein